MKKILHILFLVAVFQLLFTNISFAQPDSIYDQGIYRTYIVHKPIGYNANNHYPIVIDLHGLNSNGSQQEAYSQFDNVADTMNYIVVYPNAVAGSWDISGNSDVDFISHLVDTIRNDYSCNTCLFFTGMSDGGFMTYKLACALPKPITAIAVVSGNMTQQLQNSCILANGIPMIHFHGTADAIVSYNGAPGIPPVDTTIQWWVQQNSCFTTSSFVPLPDINLTDSCFVERYFFGTGPNGSTVTLYKIINGGHTWPGAIPLPPLGNTNQDIKASALIGSFFQGFCSAAVGIKEIQSSNQVLIYPDPVQNVFTIDYKNNNFNMQVSDLSGRNILFIKNISDKKEIDCKSLNDGIYFIKITNEDQIINRKIIIAK